MPKIKANDFDNDIFDEFIKPKKEKKKKKKKKHGDKKKKNKKKNKKKGNKKVKTQSIINSGYIGNSWDTAHEIYSYRHNKNVIDKFLDKFNVNVDVESKVGVSVKDETIAAAIGVGAQLLKGFLEKKLSK